MRRRRFGRALAALLAVATIAACNDDGGEGGQAERRRREEASGAIGEAEAIEIADGWLDELGLDQPGLDSLVLQEAVTSVGVIHVRYNQVFDDVPVRDAVLIVHVDDEGAVLGASNALTDARPPGGVIQQIEEDEARGIAEGAADRSVRETVSANVVWLPDGDQLRLGWSVQMVTDRGAEQVWVDAVTGEVADTRHVIYEGVDADCEIDSGDAPAACVLVPDPLQADELTVVALEGLDDPDSGALVGEFVDTEAGVAFGLEPGVRDPDGAWEVGPGDPGFEQVMAYFWIDAAQRFVQDLGFDEVRESTLAVISRFDDEVDNAFFSPVEELMVLGVTSGGPSVAEDASVILHEYGHAILDDQVPFAGNNPSFDAYHEAFGDLFAYLFLTGTADDPACVGPWLAANAQLVGLEGDCVRRVDGDFVFPDDIENEPHLDGQIVTAAVSDVLDGLLAAEDLTIDDCAGTDDCDEVVERVATTLLATNGFLTGTESLPEIGDAFALANRAVSDGADAEMIEAAFADHGLGEGGVITDADGESRPDDDRVEVRVAISHTFAGDLEVQLGVVDAGGNVLCGPLLLAEADGEFGSGLSGSLDLTGSECADLAPPSPDRTWVLLVFDRAARDVGRIDSFQVVVEGKTFLADTLPVAIPDNDPDGAVALVTG